MLPASAERRIWHDIRGRIKSLATSKCGIKYGVVTLEAECVPCQRTNAVSQQHPGLDAIEQLEENGAKEHFVGRLLAIIDYVPDEKLTDSIGSAVCVGEPVRLENRIL